MFKIDERISEEFDLVKKLEGLGNRTATFAFLIKYYFLTKNRSLNQSIDLLEQLAQKIDWKEVPALKGQLKDL